MDLEFQPGMSAITGETGAGKSILLDALSLTLGDRADFDKIRTGAERAEVTAQFDISHNTQAQSWLEQVTLDNDDNCIMRRVITASGKSQGWINGQPCTMAQLQELGELLISIHGQHEHQNLLRRDEQRRLLDDYAGHTELLDKYQQVWRQWQQAQARLQKMESTQSGQLERIEVLQAELEELDRLGVGENEFAELEQEQAQLAHAESLMGGLFKARQILSENEEGNIAQLCHHVLHTLTEMPVQTTAIEEARALIDSALINLQESDNTLGHALDQIELDPQRLEQVEQRISAIFHSARKFRVPPENLAEHQQVLQREFDDLENPQERINQLRQEVGQLEQQCRQLAQQLSLGRTEAAAAMAPRINAYFHTLAMPGAELKMQISDADRLTGTGLDQVEFLICTNPGKAHGPLAKIASGGELSRVSLAIQMVTAGTENTPVLVFDEIDSGIGGATAERVGELLRELGSRAQVICVTHLPQVASRAHHQLLVEKQVSKDVTATRIENLQREARVSEIARMLGGQLTPQSIEHAREMLASGNSS